MRKREGVIILLLLQQSLTFGFAPSSQPLNALNARYSTELKVQALEKETETRVALKDEVLQLVAAVPKNKQTPRRLTRRILSKVEELERTCPTPDDEVLENLGGHWELLWTAQDRKEWWKRRPYVALPLENQVYSNNPDGGPRNNLVSLFLPRFVQERLKRLGVMRNVNASARSIQSINVEEKFVRNVVNFEVPRPLGRQSRKGSVTLDIHISPNEQDPRRVDIKCDAVDLDISDGQVNLSFPLGKLGPRGWLRTVYIDDTIRIARGQKGSVFVLERTPLDENAPVPEVYTTFD